MPQPLLPLDHLSQRLEHLFTHAMAFQALDQCCHRVLLQTFQIRPEPLPYIRPDQG